MKTRYYLYTILLTILTAIAPPQLSKAQAANCELAYKQLLHPATRYSVADQIKGASIVIHRQEKPLHHKGERQKQVQNSYRKSMTIKVKDIAYGTGVVRLKYGQDAYLVVNQYDDFKMKAANCQAIPSIVEYKVTQTLRKTAPITAEPKNYGLSATYLQTNGQPLVLEPEQEVVEQQVERKVKPTNTLFSAKMEEPFQTVEPELETTSKQAKITYTPQNYGLSSNYLVNASGKRLTFPVAKKAVAKRQIAPPKKAAARSVWTSYRTPSSSPKRIVRNNQPPTFSQGKRPPVFSCTGGKCFAKLIDFCKNNNYLESNGQAHKNLNTSSRSSSVKWMK